METITPRAVTSVEFSSGLRSALFSPRLSPLFFTNGSMDISVARIYRLGLFPTVKKPNFNCLKGQLEKVLVHILEKFRV